MRRYRLTIGGKPFVIDVDEVNADTFRVVFDGEPYEVTIEGVEGESRPAVTPVVAEAAPRLTTSSPPPPSASTPAPPPAASAPPRPTATVAGGRGVLTAPMPGTVLSVEAIPGQPVRRGDPLLVLEAMKMQNVIRAPADAVVAEVLASPGQTVGFGEPLVRFDGGVV